MSNTYALILTHTQHNRVCARSISGCLVGPAFLSSQGSHPTLQGAQVLFLLMHSSAGVSGCGWLLEQQLTGVSSHISCCGLLLFDGALVLPRLLHYCRLPQCSFPAGLLIEGAPRGLHDWNPGEACMEIILPLCTIDWCAQWEDGHSMLVFIYSSLLADIIPSGISVLLVGSVCPIYHGRWKCSQRPSRCSSDIGTVHL